MIRILLVQDEDVVRTALVAVLESEPDLEVVGELGHHDDVTAMIEKQRPDVVVLHQDAHQGVRQDGGGRRGRRQGAGSMGELPAAHRLAAELGGVAVVVLTSAATRAALARAAVGPVRGFVDVDAPPGELIRVIRRVAAGEHVFDPSLVASAVRRGEDPLTARERAVLSAVAEGLRSDEIAERLLLANGTVRNYLSAILRKTGARTRLEAVRKAREAGWL